jgi:glycosyltransferase involved in cell wall biosynthesis
MNILYVLNSGNPGGMEQHVLDLVSGMMAEGHSVFVWCKDGDFSKEFEKAGAKVTTAEIKFDLDPIYIFRLFQFIKAKKIDLVHAHELKAVVNALLAGKLARVPVISHTHTPISEWKIPLWKRKINTWIYSFMVNMFSSKEIALTESRKNVKILEGIRPEKLAIIPNGVDFAELNLSDSIKNSFSQEVRARYNISSDTHVFGLISRISQEKGHSILINAYKKVKDTLKAKGIPDKTVLFIGGGGALENDIREQAKSLGISENVVITGRFSAEDQPKFYATIDSFVFPSLAEGFGIVLIEAMAHSLPVICSDLEVLQEVGGSTVRYFETGNSNELAEKMVDLYVRAEQYKDLAKQGQIRVQELFSMESFISKYLNLYSEVLEI